jgi:AsnC-type helix-turn-helix domain
MKSAFHAVLGNGIPTPSLATSPTLGLVTVVATHALLDDVGKAIVEQLQEDGRRPYATIARAVGLSEAAVRQRVARLQAGDGGGAGRR